MIGKKINQLATELAPVSTDLTIIGDPISGVSKKITLAQLGAIFSGAVSFYDDLASFPATGDINVIYCAKDTKKLYLWSGSAYVEVFPSQSLLDTYQLRSEKGVSNGYASLDSSGKVPISQLPSSIMEYKGTWSASTNTPTLANGTGDTGDVYICNSPGSVNFGAGAITFAIGDYVIYSGTIWQRSSGAVGTVTSVAASITGDAIGITGSPVTTSGTLALAFAGTSSQYINGAGNLINFPTSLVTGTGTLYALTKWGFTSGNIINSNLSDSGSVIYNTNPTAGSFAVQFNGNTTTGLSYGLLINAGSNASDIALRIQNVSSTSEYFFVYGDGKVKMNNIPNATTDTDTFLVSDGGFIKYRTGAELLSDIGGASASGYVPYTGATTNVDLGTHTLSAYNLIINHTSGSGVAASITKGGSGEALTVVKSSGSGNAASITGGVTLLDELHLNTDLADAYIASASNWNDAYNLRHNAVTLGTANGLSLSTQVLSLALASGSTTGALSSTDWTTFNNKQSALTNPVTGTGTTNYLPKFTGTSTIGNSIMSESGSTISVAGSLHIRSNNVLQLFNSDNTNGFQIYNSGATGSTNANLIFLSGAVGERMRLDASGNLGLGVTPSAWGGGNNFDLAKFAFINFKGAAGRISANVYDNAGFKYVESNAATMYYQFGGEHQWYNAPSGTAGNAISFTQAMTLNASGNLSVGNTNDTYKLDVSGTGRFTGTVAINTTGRPAGVGGGDNGKLWVKQATSGFYGIAAIASANDSFTYIGHSGTDAVLGTSYGTTGSYTDLVFQTTDTTRLRIASTGAATFSSTVGIGGVVATDYGIYRQLAVYGGATGGGITIASSGTATGVLAWANGTSGTSQYKGYIEYQHANDAMAFATGATERMRITSGGNVGIGTTVPSAKLEVNGYGTANSIMTYVAAKFYAAGTGGLNIGTDGTNPQIATDTSGVDLTFLTRVSGVFSERMRITSDGQVLIGITSTFTSARLQIENITGATTALALKAQSTSGSTVAEFHNPNGQVGAINTSGTSTSYVTTSDYRLKTDYKDFSGIDLINKIKAYDYEWKADKSRSYGVIAHELQSVINYAVFGEKDGEQMQGVDYSKIVPVLIKAIQELNDKIK